MFKAPYRNEVFFHSTESVGSLPQAKCLLGRKCTVVTTKNVTLAVYVHGPEAENKSEKIDSK